MYLVGKCTKCGKQSLEPQFDLTVEEYKKEYSESIKTMLPYENPPLQFDFLVLGCSSLECDFSEKISLEEAFKRVSVNWSQAAWIQSRKQFGSPESYENYFCKYVYEKGLHNSISESDRKQNPFIDRLIKDAEKKYSKNSTD